MKGIFVIYPTSEIECIDTYYVESFELETRLKEIQEELIQSFKLCPIRKYETNVRYMFEENNLYKYYYKKEPGWVYNSYIEKKDYLLEIRVIELKKSCETVEKECQTISKQMCEMECQTKSENTSHENKETIKVFKMLLSNDYDTIHIVKKKLD